MTADKLTRGAILSSVVQMADQGDALVKVVPTWSHLVDGNKFNLKAADKHLVRWPSKAKMNEGAVRLERAMKNAGRISTLWGLLRPVEEDEAFAADFGSIKKVYESAKRVLALTAIVNLLQNVTPSEERTDKAKALGRSNQEWLPKGLVDATQRLT